MNTSDFVVQSLSWVWLFAISLIEAHQASLSFTISQSLLKFLAMESMMLSSYLILCHSLHMLLLVFPSTRVFFSESAVCIWLQYWSFSISPSIVYLGLIYFRVDWFELLAVQGTPKNLLQHYNWKAWVVWRSVFFMAQLSQLYMTTGKKTKQNIALSMQTFVDKVMVLFFNMLSRFAISWPQTSCKTKLIVVRR